jgi:hypothetical protein
VSSTDRAPRLPLPDADPVGPAMRLDCRESPTALAVARGTARLMHSLGLACVSELALPSGRRADLVALGHSGDIWIVEIKSSIEDFRVDRKWPDYRLHSDRFFFASHPDVPTEIFPAECGFILSDGYGAEILREAPEHRLPPATRKAVMLRFARAGAARLLAAELAGVSIAVRDGESD